MERDDAPKELARVAEAAHDVAAGLHKFLTPVADHVVEITALISKCFAIKSSLLELASAVEESWRSSKYNRVSVHIEDVTHSLDYTFKDVHQIVGEGFSDAKKAKLSMTSGYRKAWRNINEHFQRQSGNPLVRRLEYCRLLMSDLIDVLHKGYNLPLVPPAQAYVHCRSPRDQSLFNDMAARVSKLLDVQEARMKPAEIDWPDSTPPASPGQYIVELRGH